MRNQKIEPDAAAKNYMGINVIFADVVNTAVYAGKNVVTPEKLENAETEVTALVYEGVDSSVTIKRLRDNRKFFTNVKGDKLSFVIYGIENQFYLHNAMPEEEIKKMQSELKEVFQFIRASKSNSKTRKLLETEPKYSSMSSDAVVLLNACTGLSIKAEENEEGVVDMCKAFADERKAGKREGKREEGVKLLGNYMKNKNVSLETAMMDLGIPLEEKEKYLRYFKEENKK